MTGDDTERRKQFLKLVLRNQLDMRRLGEKLRPSTPEAVDQRWKDQLQRWEVEDELYREAEEAAKRSPQESAASPPAIDPPQAEEAAKRSQQESAASPPAIDPPEAELREAPEAEIRQAISDVYKSSPQGEGPNVNDVIEPVQVVLRKKGLKTSGRRIRGLAEDEQFVKYRRQPGTHRQS
jgi:hypothetical protein